MTEISKENKRIRKVVEETEKKLYRSPYSLVAAYLKYQRSLPSAQKHCPMRQDYVIAAIKDRNAIPTRYANCMGCQAVMNNWDCIHFIEPRKIDDREK